MADITAKRGPIDPNDYVTNQGVATQGQIRGLDRDIRYHENQPSTWDRVMGGIKDVMSVGESALNMANSYKNLDVKDEQIEASKLNRQKTELDMENTKQQMRMKSIAFDMQLQEKKEENDYLNTVMMYQQNKDVEGLSQYNASHIKQALKYSGLIQAQADYFKTLEGEYDTSLLDTIAEAGKTPAERAAAVKGKYDAEKGALDLQIKQQQLQKLLYENAQNASNDSSSPFFSFTGGGTGGGKGSGKGKANPTMANQYAKFEYDMASAFNSVNQYKNDTTGVSSNIMGAINKLGYSMNSMDDMAHFVQTANIEVLDANNAYKINKIQEILNDKDSSAFLPTGITMDAINPSKDSGLEGMSIVKFSNSKGTSFIAVDKEMADTWRGLKNNQTTLRNLQNEYKRVTGKNVQDSSLLGDVNNPIVDTNMQAERFIKTIGQPKMSQWYNNAPAGKQKQFIEQMTTDITNSGNTRDVIDYVLYGNDVKDKWDAGSLQELQTSMEAKYRQFRKAAPGKNIQEQRMAVDNDLLRFILTETSKGTSLENIRDQILAAEDSRSLAWEVEANDKLATIDTLIEQQPDTEVEISNLPTPSYGRQLEQGVENIGKYVGNLPSKVLPVSQITGPTIPVKEVPSYVTKRFLDNDVKKLLVQQEVNKLTRENNRNTGPTPASVTTKLKKEAENKVDKSIYEFVVRAHAKGVGYKTIAKNLLLVEDISQLPALLNNMLSMSEVAAYSFNTRDNWRANQLRKKEQRNRVKEALED